MAIALSDGIGTESEYDRRLSLQAETCATVRIDLATDILVVYTSGTTGRPKGAVVSVTPMMKASSTWSIASRT